MGRPKSGKNAGEDFLSNEVFKSPIEDRHETSEEFSKRYETIREFQEQLDRDIRVTKEDLRKEFQI